MAIENITKKEALARVFSAALEYKNNLVNQSLLFICTDKHKRTFHLEVTFDASNFRHMTGFETNIEPRHFFEMCLDCRLTEKDFEFSDDGTTQLKMLALPKLVKKNLSANMLGDYNMAQPKLYTEKIAGGVYACIGFIRTGRYGRYVPNTVLEGDIRKKVKQANRIVLTYRKKRGEEKYSEIVYAAKKVDWNKFSLPQEYEYLPLPQTTICETTGGTVPVKSGEVQQDKKKEEREIQSAIITYRDIEWDDDQILKKLEQRFGLSEEEALKYMIKAEG